MAVAIRAFSPGIEPWRTTAASTRSGRGFRATSKYPPHRRKQRAKITRIPPSHNFQYDLWLGASGCEILRSVYVKAYPQARGLRDEVPGASKGLRWRELPEAMIQVAPWDCIGRVEQASGGACGSKPSV